MKRFVPRGLAFFHKPINSMMTSFWDFSGNIERLFPGGEGRKVGRKFGRDGQRLKRG